VDSQIYPHPRRRIPSHARRRHRRHRQGTFLIFLLGAAVLGALTLGSVAGVRPSSPGAAPSFGPVTIGAARDAGAGDPSALPPSDLQAESAGLSTAPAGCEAVAPTASPAAPAHPGADVSFAPMAAPHPRSSAVFLGDSYTSGYEGVGEGATGWPAIVSAAFGWRFSNLAVPGTGFVNPGWTAEPMRTQLAEVIRLKPGVVVIAGGHNDRRYGADRASDAADDVIDRLRTALPNAILVVVGPIWQDGSPAPAIVGLRNHLRSKAAAVGALFIDPLAGRWFAGSNHAFIGADGIHPTSAGHRHIAALVLAALRADPRFARPAVEVPTATPTPAPADGAWAPAGRSVLVTACAR
jgi:lysophospholipase L1-like esterase